MIKLFDFRNFTYFKNFATDNDDFLCSDDWFERDYVSRTLYERNMHPIWLKITLWSKTCSLGKRFFVILAHLVSHALVAFWFSKFDIDATSVTSHLSTRSDKKATDLITERHTDRLTTQTPLTSIRQQNSSFRDIGTRIRFHVNIVKYYVFGLSVEQLQTFTRWSRVKYDHQGTDYIIKRYILLTTSLSLRKTSSRSTVRYLRRKAV